MRLGDRNHRQTILAEAPLLAPKVSDVELLSIVCQLGRAATETSIRHAIDERIGREVSVVWVRHRIAEIEAAGFVTSLKPRRGVPAVRLTALGVERLSGLVERSAE
jgi:hypothetical protein